jgi:hypothetical protein
MGFKMYKTKKQKEYRSKRDVIVANNLVETEKVKPAVLTRDMLNTHIVEFLSKGGGIQTVPPEKGYIKRPHRPAGVAIHGDTSID